MKNNNLYTFLIAAIFILLVNTSCKKESSVEITSFNIVQNDGSVDLTYSVKSESNVTYHISYDLVGNSSDPFIDFSTSENNSISKTLDELNLREGSEYSFHIKAVTDNGEESAWYGPINILIVDYCTVPTSLHITSLGLLSWHEDAQNPDASFYEIKYGAVGFDIETEGITLSTNNSVFYPSEGFIFEEGNTYQIYVRGYCDVQEGWSEWSESISYYAENNINICMLPTFVNWSIIYNGLSQPIGANFTWVDDGNNTDYECNLVHYGSDPTSNPIDLVTWESASYTVLTQNTYYDFYVRTVCIDNSTTEWVGPLTINIGD